MICVMLDAEFIWLSMDAQRYDTPKHRSMGEYGPLRGVDRILDALNRFHAKATFFTPGIFAEAYPDTVKKIVQAGHEIALHGHHHEDFATLSPEERRAVIRQGCQSVTNVAGKKPVGFRLPEGGCTEETLQIIHEAGFLYDNSFFDHDIPYRVHHAQLADDMIEIPTRWELIDFPYLAWGDSFPAGNARIAIYDDVLDNWVAGAGCRLRYGLLLRALRHPADHRLPGRMFMLNTVLEQITRKNIWLATGEEIAGYVKSL
ncbi:MAG: polysaccharide deacetylase family protein [Flavonifractor plautii]